jgi:hypothetical protein
MKYVKQPRAVYNYGRIRRIAVFTEKKAKIYVNLLIYFDYATEKKKRKKEKMELLRKENLTPN